MRPDAPNEAAQQASRRHIVLVGGVYLLVGALWILLSDALVEAISTDPAWLLAAQRYKGLVYILLTTLGLVFLMRLGHRRLLNLRAQAAATKLQVQDLFMGHPTPMWVCDAETGQFLQVNDAAVAHYGYSRAQFVAMRDLDLLATQPANEPRTGPAPAATQPLLAGTVLHRKLSGSVLHARLTQHSLNLNDRPATMVMAQDVSAEVQMHNALARQQAQFAQLHQSLGEVLWMASADGQQLLYVSPAFETLYGRSTAELIAQPGLWLQAVHPDDRPAATALGRANGDGDAVEATTCQYRIVRPDGSVRWVEDRKKAIYDEAGHVVMIGGIAEDITARHERDDARLALHGQLERLVAERTLALEQANAELEAFSHTAAHDLKSPLNGIIGLSQLLSMQFGAQLGETGGRYAAQITRSGFEMAKLINDLLGLSGAARLAMQASLVDLAPLARQLVAELRRSEPERQVTVQLPASLPLYCDPGLMRSLLQNLLANAWKFTAHQPQAEISLWLETTATHSLLHLADNGAGFEAKQAGATLQPFQRFHSQTQFPGHGLGLVTCQRIARRHGGELCLSSSPGLGTTVTVSLPHPPPAVAEAANTAARLDADLTVAEPTAG